MKFFVRVEVVQGSTNSGSEYSVLESRLDCIRTESVVFNFVASTFSALL